MKNILTCICCVLVQIGLAQPVFNTYSDAGFGHLIRTPDNEMIACGRTYSGSNSQLWKFDANGNVIWSNILPLSANARIKSITITNDHNYLLGGGTYSVSGEWRLVFIKVSPNGDILQTIFPNFTKRFDINDAYQLPDQSFVAVGASGNYGTPNYAVLTLDSTLTNVLSFIEHQVESDTFFTNWQTVHDSHLSPDKATVVSVCADGATGSSINSDSYVLKSSIDGQLIWKTKIDNGQKDQAMGLGLLADHSIVVTGITNQDYWTTWDRMFITKLDVNGQILWQHFFDSTGVGAPLIGIEVMEMNNGDILTTGRKIGGPKDNIFLLLTDANGIEKSRLLLQRDEHEDYPWSTVLLDNNVLAIAGYQDQFWLHKNLLVLLPFALLSDAKEAQVDSPLFNAFPNPFDANISIEYKGQSPPIVALQLTIYSSAGNKIYTGDLLNSFNFKNFPAGMYYLVVTDKRSPASFVRRIIKR